MEDEMSNAYSTYGKYDCTCDCISCSKDVSGSGDEVPLIFNLGTIWRKMMNFTLRQIYPRNLLDRGLGGFQIRTGYRGLKRRVEVVRESNPCHPAGTN
jgi:hypothetical protein